MLYPVSLKSNKSGGNHAIRVWLFENLKWGKLKVKAVVTKNWFTHTIAYRFFFFLSTQTILMIATSGAHVKKGFQSNAVI